MKSLFILSATIILSFALFASDAQAGIVHAGTPDTVHVETAPDYRYPDIYQRQLEYRETSQLLRDDILERQKSYIAPHLEVTKQYEEDLQDIYQTVK